MLNIGKLSKIDRTLAAAVTAAAAVALIGGGGTATAQDPGYTATPTNTPVTTVTPPTSAPTSTATQVPPTSTTQPTATSTATTVPQTCTAIAGATTLTLTGAEEVPPVATPGVTATFSYRLDGTTLTWRLQASGTGITMAHFHQGAKGVNGPVVYFFFGPVPAGVPSFDTCGTVTAAGLIGPLAGNLTGFLASLKSGDIYVNVHSTAYPAGAVRIQMPPTPGATPVAPATGEGVANAPDTSAGLALAAGVGVIAVAAGAVVAVRRARR